MRQVQTANGKTRSKSNNKKQSPSQSPAKSLKSESRNSKIKRVGGGFSFDRSKEILHLSRENSVETTCKCSDNKYRTEYGTLDNGGDSIGCPVHSDYSVDRMQDNSMIMRDTARKKNNRSNNKSQTPSTKAFKLKLA
jgi:hypothetical protein